MLVGAHAIIHSKAPEADRAFLGNVLELPYVDVGEGWLIFGLPPAEVAVHPSGKNDVHELYLMVEDVAAFAKAMKERGIGCGPARDMGWGLLTSLKLPGGGKVGVYQPRHARPPAMAQRSRGSAARRRAPRRAKAPAPSAGPARRA